MNWIHHPKRYLLDLAVGIVLSLQVLLGSIFIYRLNNDARDLTFNSALAMQGQQLSTDLGCVACHTVDGSPGVGPSWVNMWGKLEKIGKNGKEVLVDENYFRESLADPSAKVVQDFPSVMSRYFLSEPEINALIDYIKQLSPATTGNPAAI